ncbi:MAG: efflux RND transporter periplasmic adaptor subunit [Paracoccaceae bacterium]
MALSRILAPAALPGVPAFLCALLVPWLAAAQQGPARVVVAPVEAREIADTAPVVASLVATLESEVASRAAGIVDDVAVMVGDRVEAGTVLVRLDEQLARIEERNAEAALAAARAAVAAAEARATQAQQALDRAGGLRGSSAFSRGSFEDLQQGLAAARSEIARAEAEVGVAAAALARARYDLEHMNVRAPFPGRVVERMAQPGEYVALGQPLARLLDASSLEVEADVPVDLVEALTPGTRIAMRVDGGHEAGAVVRATLPVETASTRTRTVRLVIEGGEGSGGLPERLAAVGRSVTLAVPVSAPREAPVIPKDALVQGPGGWSVFVADDGQATPRGVGLGQSAGSHVEVVRGVAIGEHVVVRGNERLRPGQPLAPVLADGTALDAAAPDADDAPGEAVSEREGARRAAESETRVAAESGAPATPPDDAPAVPAGSAGAATRPAAQNTAPSGDRGAPWTRSASPSSAPSPSSPRC